MSAAAGYIRAQLLRRQADAAKREAAALWLTLDVADGLGGVPESVSLASLAEAADRAERLSLEAQAAL